MKLSAIFRRYGILFLKSLCVSTIICIIFAVGCMLTAKTLSERNAEHYTPIKVAVVNNDNSDTGKLALNMLTGSVKSINEVLTLEITSEDTAMSELENGEITGVIIIPDGAINGYLYGKDVPIKIIVSDVSPYEAVILKQMGEVGKSMLTSGRSGSYTVQRIMYEKGSSDKYSEIAEKTDLILLSRTAGAYSDMTDWKSINIKGALLPLLKHHILCFIVFFLICSSMLWSEFILADSSPDMLRRLKCCKISFTEMILVKSVYLFLFNSIAVTCLIAAASEAFDLHVRFHIVPIITTALLITSITVFAFNLLGKFAAPAVVSAIAICGLVSGGGIIPSPLLPEIFTTLGSYFPNRLCYSILSVIFGADYTGYACVTSICASAVMISMGILTLNLKVRLSSEEAMI